MATKNSLESKNLGGNREEPGSKGWPVLFCLYRVTYVFISGACTIQGNKTILKVGKELKAKKGLVILYSL
jgi:hypothetical protein